MKQYFNVLSTTTGIVVVGLIFGVLAVLLQQAGNPGNMGICVVCFNRDIAGAVGLHRAEVVQYLRPEILGMVLGAFAAAMLFGEYKPRGGSAPSPGFFSEPSPVSARWFFSAAPGASSCAWPAATPMLSSGLWAL